MKTLRILVLSLICLLTTGIGRAQQQSAFRAVRQEMAILPDSAASLFVVDDRLYCKTAGVILRANRVGEQITGFVPDTNWVKYDDGIDYVVRHPVSGDLYYTSCDRKGRSQLYVVRNDESKRTRAKHVSLDNLEVFHPTFSKDGRIMVFATTGRQGDHHDYDLWYVRLTKEEFGTPHNMGVRVNTRSDETAPVILGDYLFFSSGGHESPDGTARLCVTPLMAYRTTGDTVGMPQVGYGRINTLPEPFNTVGAVSTGIAFDTLRGCSYWMSPSSAPTSSTALLPIYTCRGSLRPILLWGYVRDADGNALSGVKVTTMQGNAASSETCSTVTDNLGYYSFYLPMESSHVVVFRRAGCFSDTLRVKGFGGEESFVVEMQRDVTLGGIPLRTQVYYFDLFGPNVSTSLSDHGIRTLRPLVRFLRDNPTFRVELTLTADMTDNAEFNALLTGQRLETLQRYLADCLPATVKTTFRNGCDGRKGSADASGLSRLTVVVKEK